MCGGLPLLGRSVGFFFVSRVSTPGSTSVVGRAGRRRLHACGEGSVTDTAGDGADSRVLDQQQPHAHAMALERLGCGPERASLKPRVHCRDGAGNQIASRVTARLEAWAPRVRAAGQRSNNYRANLVQVCKCS